MGRRKPAPVAPSGGITWLHWNAPKPAPRNPEPWNVDAPKISERWGGGSLDDTMAEVNAAIAALTGDEPDAEQAIYLLKSALQAATRVSEGLDTLQREIDTLEEHTEELREAAKGVAARVGEADEIREAVERYPHTAPDVWADALRVVRTGGSLRDMWNGGKS